VLRDELIQARQVEAAVALALGDQGRNRFMELFVHACLLSPIRRL
jgi:hypothetical protein